MQSRTLLWMAVLFGPFLTGCQNELVSCQPVGQGMEFIGFYHDRGLRVRAFRTLSLRSLSSRSLFGEVAPVASEAADIAEAREHLMFHERVRPAYPGFRSLCTLLNSRLPDWSDLMILECISPRSNSKTPEQKYGFVVLAFTKTGPIAFSNVSQEPDEKVRMQFGPSVHEFKVDSEQAHGFMERLEKFSSEFPDAFLWRDRTDPSTLGSV